MDNGTTPSSDIPTNDICGTTHSVAYDLGSYDVSLVLPVELTYFKGTLTAEKTIQLIWQTATEENNPSY